MLATPEPIPTGLITAILGRARVPAYAISETIGPSPRQMRELTEGRGLFSPYKIRRVSELTRVPEDAIRDALDRIPEMVKAVNLATGSHVDHPRLGRCQIVKYGDHMTVRTENGKLIEGVHPLSVAAADLLDAFGLIPEPSPEGAGSSPSEPDTEAAIRVKDEEPDTSETVRKTDRATLEGRPETPDKEADTQTSQETMTEMPDVPEPVVVIGPEPDPRALLLQIVERSGRSQAALSRALGKDPAYLNAILKRGRRVPEGLVERLSLLCAAEPEPAWQDAAVKREPGGKAGSEPVPVEPIAEPPAPLDPVGSVSASAAPLTPTPNSSVINRSEILRFPTPTPQGSAPRSDLMEVIIDGVCRVRVPAGFDMEAAARLIRAVSSAASAMHPSG